MRDPWEWQEEDIQALLREQRQEDLRLEYKKSDALAKTDARKRELSKDVSAMANSAGGTIVYGIDEQRATTGVPILDGGVDPQEFSREWLEQVIDSGIQRRIEGIVVRAVTITGTQKVAYVVYVPQSNRAPHMAADHRYYKRLGTITAVMEDYEVRDVSRRSEAPDLYLTLTAMDSGGTGIVHLEPRIGNRSSEPVLYATCRLYFDLRLAIEQNRFALRWSRLGEVELLWRDTERIRFCVAHYSWTVPGRDPILEGEEYPMDPIQLNVGSDFKQWPEIERYNIGWELRAPRSLPRLQGMKLRVDRTGPRIENFLYSLARTP